MAKYRKKPVVIEAFQWFKVSAFDENETRVVDYYRHPDMDGQYVCPHCSYAMHDHGYMDTLEGGHTVCPGDWIITGVKKEMYPCKPDIFEATYNPVFDNSTNFFMPDDMHKKLGSFFKNDESKIVAWWCTSNALLGNVSPKTMCAMGREEKLRRWIDAQLAQNEFI